MKQIVTPDEARDWLRYTEQKTVDMQLVTELALSMKHSWEPDKHLHQPVIVKTYVSGHGKVKSGNHRLLALLIHNEPVEMHVRFEDY